MAGLRPLLLATRPQDPPEKITWVDEHWTRVEGGRAAVEVQNGVIYMAASLRNAGNGIAVLHSWECVDVDNAREAPVESDFRRLSRDLYIPANDSGFWQGAIRDEDDPEREQLLATIEQRRRILVDVLYGDQEGGQRTVTRFMFIPIRDDSWMCSAVRHWNLDREDRR